MEAAGLKSKQCLILVPGSAHADKCWPAERFAKAAEAIHDSFGFAIAAVGTPQDKEMIRLIQTCCRCRISDLSGKTTLPELGAIFEQSAAVISNDTGPGHIAAAVGIPLVMVFGRTNPLRLEPYGRPECVAAVDREKRGIAIDSKNPAWRIEHVSVEMVLDKIMRQLQGQRSV
jgi:heptosyltransferase-3